MSRHRLLPPVPRPAPVLAPHAFVLLPVFCLPVFTSALWMEQQRLYQLAYEQTQEANRPSVVERDLLGVWN